MAKESDLQYRAEATATAERDQRFTGEKWATARGSWTIFPDLCKGCGLCIKWSPDFGAYGTNRVTVNAEGCITCKTCAYYCPDAAISVDLNERKSG